LAALPLKEGPHQWPGKAGATVCTGEGTSLNPLTSGAAGFVFAGPDIVNYDAISQPKEGKS
jgi:hypothetical protein